MDYSLGLRVYTGCQNIPQTSVHALCTEFAAKDPTSKMAKARVDGALDILVCETPATVVDGEFMAGIVRCIVNDMFSYDVYAVAHPPNLIKVYGRHERPCATELPVGTKIHDRLTEGEWVKDFEGSISSTIYPVFDLLGIF